MKKLCAILAFVGSCVGHEELNNPSVDLSIKVNPLEVLSKDIVQIEIGKRLDFKSYQNMRLVCKDFRDLLKADGRILIISKIIGKGAIQEDFQHLKDILRVHWNAKGIIFWDSFVEIQDDIFLSMSLFEQISFSAGWSQVLATLWKMPNLKEVRLPHMGSIMPVFPPFKRLETLGINNLPSNFPFTLYSLPNLTELRVFSPNIRLRNPKNFKKLKSFTCAITSKLIARDLAILLPTLEELPALKELCLECVSLKDVDLRVTLPVFPLLETLEISGCLINSESVKQIAQYSDLTKLDITGSRIPIEELSTALEKLSKLQELNARYTHIDKRGVSSIGSLKALTNLDLGDCKEIKGGEFIPLSKLIALDVRNTNFNDLDMAILPALSSLKKLDVTGSQVSDEAIEKAKKFYPQIKIVN